MFYLIISSFFPKSLRILLGNKWASLFSFYRWWPQRLRACSQRSKWENLHWLQWGQEVRIYYLLYSSLQRLHCARCCSNTCSMTHCLTTFAIWIKSRHSKCCNQHLEGGASEGGRTTVTLLWTPFISYGTISRFQDDIFIINYSKPELRMLKINPNQKLYQQSLILTGHLSNHC